MGGKGPLPAALCQSVGASSLRQWKEHAKRLSSAALHEAFPTLGISMITFFQREEEQKVQGRYG